MSGDRPKARDELLNLLAMWGLTTGKGSRAHADRILGLHEAELAKTWAAFDAEKLEYLRPDDTIRGLEANLAAAKGQYAQDESDYVTLTVAQMEAALELLRRYRTAFVNAGFRARAADSTADRYVGYAVQLRNALQDSLLGTMAGIWDHARQEARVTALWAFVEAGEKVVPRHCGDELDGWVCTLKPGLHPGRKHQDREGHVWTQTVCPNCGNAWGTHGCQGNCEVTPL